MKSVRQRLTYANVMSSIAVFLVLAGGSALAANQLGKNSVGSKQLKNNAVTSAKIKKGAVTGSKLKLSSIGTVPSATNAGHATSADSATNAVNAQNAQTAANASAVNGQGVVKIFQTMTVGQTATVASFSGFTIVAKCESNNVDATLITPASAGSVAWAQGNGSSTGSFFEYDSEEVGTPSEVGLDGPDTYGTSTFNASLSNGLTATGTVGFDYGTFDDNPPGICIVSGHATVG